MVKPEFLERFVARVMSNLPDSLSERKQDLVTLLVLLPKNFSKRTEIIRALEAIRAHEMVQGKFKLLLGGGK